MGAETFEAVAYGKDVDEAFKKCVDKAHYDHGHAGYTGTIAEKGSYVRMTPEVAKDFCSLVGRVAKMETVADYIAKVGEAERVNQVLHATLNIAQRLEVLAIPVNRTIHGGRTLGLYHNRGGYRWIELHTALSGEELRTTFLHELAHGIVDQIEGMTGHGRMWRRIMLLLKVRPKARRAVTGEVQVAMCRDAKYLYKCLDCGEILPFFRRAIWMNNPNRKAWHGPCKYKLNHGTLEKLR